KLENVNFDDFVELSPILSNFCIEVSKRYPAFLSLFKEVINRIKQSNGEITSEKLKNYFWDIHLMFNVSNHLLNGEPVLFVTSDKAMVSSVRKSQLNINILTYPEFKNLYLL